MVKQLENSDFYPKYQRNSAESRFRECETSHEYHILLVDDNEDYLFICKKIIERSKGFTVDIVSSAMEGLERLQICSYDAIVSDYDMPDMNGIVFFETIRSRGYLIPFMIFSYNTKDEIAKYHPIPQNVRFFWKGKEPKHFFSELIDNIRSYSKRDSTMIY